MIVNDQQSPQLVVVVNQALKLWVQTQVRQALTVLLAKLLVGENLAYVFKVFLKDQN